MNAFQILILAAAAAQQTVKNILAKGMKPNAKALQKKLEVIDALALRCQLQEPTVEPGVNLHGGDKHLFVIRFTYPGVGFADEYFVHTDTGDVSVFLHAREMLLVKVVAGSTTFTLGSKQVRTRTPAKEDRNEVCWVHSAEKGDYSLGFFLSEVTPEEAQAIVENCLLGSTEGTDWRPNETISEDYYAL